MQSTTRSDGGSRARIIYHTPGKSFAWLQKDGSFADFQKALRARLNISKNEPLVIKQIDGDYTLDIETEEEYEAFCHFAKSASQLHVSVNGGLKGQSMAGGVESASSSTTLLPGPPSNPGPQPPAESEDPTLGKRKASQITTDPEATPSATQKRKKRRKVGPGQSASAASNFAAVVTPSELRGEEEPAPGDSIRDATNTDAVADSNQPAISATKKKKKRKNARAAQGDSTHAESTEQPAEPVTEPVDPPESPPFEPPKTKKQKKTVVLELSDVIPSPAGTQESSSGSTARPLLPKSAPEPSTSTTQGATKKPLAKTKANQPAGSPELVSNTPPAPYPSGVEEPVPSGPITKPKSPKRKTGGTDGSTVVEKGQKQQDPVKKPEQQKTGKPKKSQKTQKAEPAKRVESPNAPSIQEIMDGVIAAAMQDAKKRASTSWTTTYASENLTPPSRKNPKAAAKKTGPADAPGPKAGSPTTLLGAIVPAPKTVDSDSTTARKKTRTGKPHAASPELPSLPKNRAKSSTPLTAPPPNQKAMQKSPQARTRSGGDTSSEDEDSVTPRKKPAPISDPSDELDAFLHAPTNSSQKSILEDLPSDSEEEEEVEREDVEVDEEDEVPRPKGKGREQLKAMARAESSSDDSEPESVASDPSAKANQANIGTQVTHVSETRGVVPSSDFEGDGEALPHPTESANASTHVVPPGSSPSSPGPCMTPISNLKSAGRALSFFNERVIDKPDPIENDSSHAEPRKGLPDDAEDPIQDPDTTSTPRPKLTKGKEGLEETASRKNGAGAKVTQNSLTFPLNSMLPPPTPPPKIKGNFTFSQPLDQSTPAPSISRRKQLASQTTAHETSPRSTWTTLPQGEKSTQFTDEPAVDELVSSPSESTSKLPKVTPVKKPASSPLVKQTPLFFPDTSQYRAPSSDPPTVEKLSSEEEDEGDEEEEEEEEKMMVPPSQRVLRTSAAKSRTTTPYRGLSVIASQRSIFPSTPVEPVGPAPTASQVKAGSDDDDEDDEDSGVSESDSDSPQPSHIPKGRLAGARNGNRRKGRGQLSLLS